MGDNKDRTLYCGNLSEKVTEELLYELFLQAGPLEYVKIPKGRNFGFITFKHEVSVPYAVALMSGLSLYGREMRLELRSGAAAQHNKYFDIISAHQRNLIYQSSPKYSPHNNNFMGQGFLRHSPYPMGREGQNSHLKDRYANSHFHPDLNISPWVNYNGMSQICMPYGQEPLMRTFSSPADNWHDKSPYRNHMRDRNRY